MTTSVIESGSLRIIDLTVTRWMARSGPVLLRMSLGAIFLWFGALKFFPDLSPAQDLATRTMSVGKRIGSD